MTQDKVRKLYRLPPCPTYDVAGTEGWLEEMARRGWFLAKDGFFAGVAVFERGTPKPARYRLAGALKSTSMWSDDGGGPDPEEIALGEKYAWEYVCIRGDFYIYRTFDPDARELNTDPAVQAESIKVVKKRRCGAVLTSFVWVLVALAKWSCGGGFFLDAITVHTWFLLFTTLMVLLLLAGSLREEIRLGKLQKQLQNGEALTPVCPTPRQARRFWGREAVSAVCVIAWGIVIVNLWLADTLNAGELPLEQYDQPLPFATLDDFAGDGASGYQETLSEFNSVREWSDWLAPRNIKWAEHARITCADGTVLSGGLYVDYHETAAPWIAAGLARDYVRYDRGRNRKNYAPLDAPEVGADFIQAYVALFPTVVIQKGNIVVHVLFYQTGESPEMPLEEWAALMAESISCCDGGETKELCAALCGFFPANARNSQLFRQKIPNF